MYFKVLAFLTIVMSCHMASPLSNLQEIRELLEEIRVMQEQVNPLDSAVMDIVEKVYSPDLQTRLTRVKDEEGRDCGEGWTASCGNELCDQGTCFALCDAQKLGQGHNEKYWCQCNDGYTGAYCNVTRTNKQELCKEVCPTAPKCYMMSQSKSGVYCYSSKWALLNPEDSFQERSLEELSEMGMFAEVVKRIMRRQMGNLK